MIRNLIKAARERFTIPHPDPLCLLDEPESVLGDLIKGTAVVLLVLLAVHLFCPQEARAQTVGVHVASLHVPHHDGYNNATVGAYYRDASGVTVGAFRNSLRRESVYLAYSGHAGPVGITAGFVTGYQRKCTWGEWYPVPGGRRKDETCFGTSSHRWTPMLVPSYALPAVQGLTPRVSVVLAHRGSTALHLSIERGL